MSLKVLECPKCVLWCGSAEVLRERFAVRRKRKPRKDDQAVKRPAQRLRRHHEGDRQDPQADPVVATPEADLDDSVPGLFVNGGVVHDDKDVATLSRGTQCTLLVEEPLHEVGPGEPVEQEPVVPVPADDGDVVGLGPPAAADDEVGTGVRRQSGCLLQKVAAHEGLARLPSPRNHHHHRPALHKGGKPAVPSRKHLEVDLVYISLP